MLKLNALDILHRRQLDAVAPNFAKIKLAEGDLFGTEVETWIKSKLAGRFYIKRQPSIAQDGKLKTATYVGFEDHKELTYFMLACPHIRRNT
jgi:hypothetical protein